MSRSGIHRLDSPCPLLILAGPRYAPAVLAAYAAGAILVPGITSWWEPRLLPSLITLNLTGVAILVRRLHGDVLLPGTMRETSVFGIVTIGAPALLALVGTSTAVLIGISPPNDFVDNGVRVRGRIS